MKIIAEINDPLNRPKYRWGLGDDGEVYCNWGSGWLPVWSFKVISGIVKGLEPYEKFLPIA